MEPGTHGTYYIEQVLPHVHAGRVELDGEYVKTGRFMIFLKKGTKCVSCGLEAKFFRKEKSNDTTILNLYGIDSNNRYVLFTRDHIIPASRGGTKAFHNMQPMCEDCNQKKGNAISFRDRVFQTFKAIKNFFLGIKFKYNRMVNTLKAIWR